MTLIQVVPDTNYMIWQLYVQMLNFRDHGLEQDAVILVACAMPSPAMKEFEKWTSAKVYYYEDTRKSKFYTSSIRPHLLAKYYKEHQPKVVCYHDQDIIFTRKPDFTRAENSQYCYVARQAHSYTAPVEYFLHKFKKYQFYSMCEILEVKDEVLIQNNCYCGGAQSIIKGVDHTFWEWQELKCEQLYRYFSDITKIGLRQWIPEEDLPAYHVQIWATDMYVLFAGLLRFEKQIRHYYEIDFDWPFDPTNRNHWMIYRDSDESILIDGISESQVEEWTAKNPGSRGIKAYPYKTVMHNAGVVETNRRTNDWRVEDEHNNIYHHKLKEEDAKRVAKENADKGWMAFKNIPVELLFCKSDYAHDRWPFGDDFSFVTPDKAQYTYVQLIKRLSHLSQNKKTMEKKKILAVFNTHNQIHPQLLQTTLQAVKNAADNTTATTVQVVTCSWEPIPNNPFKAFITPYRNLGHLNYLLQIKQIVLNVDDWDIITFLEHDMMYPPNYFNRIMEQWDFGKYGVWDNNYIGMNESGWLGLKRIDQPMSMLSVAKSYYLPILDQKINEVIKSIDNNPYAGYPMGWTCVEPDNKGDFKMLDHTNEWPAVHFNMNHLGNHGTGKEGKNHHLSAHYVIYDDYSTANPVRPDWGDYKQYWKFNQEAKVLAMVP